MKGWILLKNGLHSYLKENVRHGTASFPAGFYSTRIPRDFQDMLVHWHEELEFSRVRRGTLCYDIGQMHYRLQEGDILLIAPDTLHSAHQLEAQEAATDSIVFHLRLAGLGEPQGSTERYLRPIAEEALQIPPVIRPEDPWYPEIRTCFREMWECRDAALPYRELRFRAQVFTLIRLIWQRSDEAVAEAPGRAIRQHEDKLKLALAYMQEHYTETVTVRQLADLCGFSQVHFMHIFKAAIGTTCMEYLIGYRLARAAMELLETDHSVTQAALDNGFQNISYFNRAFKRQYGATPSEYRRSRL